MIIDPLIGSFDLRLTSPIQPPSADPELAHPVMTRREEISLLLGRTSFPTAGNAQSGQDRSPTESTAHTGFNPFHVFPNSTLYTYLKDFITHVNHLYYFFREDDLENAFLDQSIHSTRSSDFTTELCLLLAIGAKIQRVPDQEVSTVCYAYGINGLQQVEPRKSIWIIRALAMLSFYHMDEEMGSSCRYLSLSLHHLYVLQTKTDVECF